MEDAGDVVEGEENEGEEEDRMEGRPCWCRQNQQLQVLRWNQHL